MKPDLNQYLTELEEVPCNICGVSSTTVFAERERFGLPIISVQCRECGLLYLNPRPTKRMYEAYNRADYRVVSFGTSVGDRLGEATQVVSLIMILRCHSFPPPFASTPV